MKGSISLKFCISAIALCLTGSALTEALTPAQFQEVAQKNVIVILRDQMLNVPPERRAMGARSAALAAAHNSVLSQLPHMGGRKVHSFSTINAFATTVSASEAAQLAAHPMVQAVVADAVIRPLVRSKKIEASAGTTGGPSADAGALCNTLEPEALQLTHTAFADPSTPQAQQVRDGNGQPVTGKGVKVAYIADGLDPNVPGFIRPDGSHVFIDYQDFSGDPAGTSTLGGEAFGDASSIAAQDMPNGKPLNFDISKFVNAAHPLPAPCTIRIRGMAPGASLVGLKVFSAINPTTTSFFIQAIEYAVVHDDVDVLNESFGGNPFPDNTNDPISLANDAAVRAGVTVVVSTGDAGTNGTLGSPSTESSVIASGATTQFRLYAQTGDGVLPLEHGNGYIDDNISAFSSGGFAQKNARTVDAVAPGDLGWALCSTNQALFNDCGDNTAAFGTTPIQAFGGTSESSPLTAGEAALVIQAYRSTHHGADPTPATVKRIIMSTATDLGAPASEQGAGLINSLAAVHAALAIDDENGRPKPQGSGLLAAPTSALITGKPNTPEERSFTITNTGSTVSTVAFVAQSTVPINMDAFNSVGTGVGGTGAPDIYARKIGSNTVAALLSEPEIPYSIWLSVPSLIGPYGPTGTPTEPVTTTAFVLMQAFDSAVAADSGDIWADLTLSTSTFNPLVLTSGATGTINLVITPDPTQVGNTITGFVYVDTFNPVVSTGDEVVRIPYSYTIAP
jgi:Subtilase family/Peptidase inhibitor I9